MPTTLSSHARRPASLDLPFAPPAARAVPFTVAPEPPAPPAPPLRAARQPRACSPESARAWVLLDWAAQRTGARMVGVEPDAGGVPVLVRRMLLVHARRALRPFRADLGCVVEPDRIRFSWHGGRGGLVLSTRCLSEPSARRPDGSVLFAPMGESGIVEAPVLWGAP